MARFLVEIRNATVYLKDRPVLRDIHWTLRENEHWALVGNNGSGKTTLLKLIFGELLPVEGGAVHWFGSRVWRGLEAIRRQTGLVSAEFQQTYDQNLPALEVVVSGWFSSIGLWEQATANQRRAARALMEFLGLASLRSRPFLSLSYGERRRVLLARALVHRPRLLILDEPCAGLDIPAREQFLDTLSRLARTRTRLVYVTHHVEELLPVITHVCYLKSGRIFAAGPRETMLRDAVISRALGCPIRLTENEGRVWVTGCRPRSRGPLPRRS